MEKELEKKIKLLEKQFGLSEKDVALTFFDVSVVSATPIPPVSNDLVSIQ